MQDSESLLPRELESQDVPRVQQRPCLAVGPLHVPDPLFHVDLVKTESGGRGPGQLHVAVLAEFANGLEVREGVRIVEEMMEGDQGVRLAPAIGHLQLPDRLVALSCEASGHIPGQVAKREGRIGEGEKLLGVFVEGPATGPADHLVEVGGELRQRQLTGAKLGLECYDLVPGDGGGGHGS